MFYSHLKDPQIQQKRRATESQVSFSSPGSQVHFVAAEKSRQRNQGNLTKSSQHQQLQRTSNKNNRQSVREPNSDSYALTMFENLSHDRQARNTKDSAKKSKKSLKLGEQVMEKLENLLVDIQQPKKKKVKKRAKTEFSNQPISTSSRIESLHQIHHSKLTKNFQHETSRLYEEISHLKPYTVENKVSQYLNVFNPDTRNSFLERSRRFSNKKQQTVQRILEEKRAKAIRQEQQEYQYCQQALKRVEQKCKARRQQEKQQEQINPTTHQSLSRKVNIFQDLQLRQKQRQKHKRQKQIQDIHQRARQLHNPKVSQSSQKIFSTILQKKQLSKNFMQRNEQLTFQKKLYDEKQHQFYDSQYQPFAPKVSEASQAIVQNKRLSRRKDGSSGAEDGSSSKRYNYQYETERKKRNPMLAVENQKLLSNGKGDEDKYCRCQSARGSLSKQSFLQTNQSTNAKMSGRSIDSKRSKSQRQQKHWY